MWIISTFFTIFHRFVLHHWWNTCYCDINFKLEHKSKFLWHKRLKTTMMMFDNLTWWMQFHEKNRLSNIFSAFLAKEKSSTCPSVCYGVEKFDIPPNIPWVHRKTSSRSGDSESTGRPRVYKKSPESTSRRLLYIYV